jgi:capsular exopolysaccharide synthesis family protein
MKINKKKHEANNGDISDIFLANYSRKSRFAEAYRTLRTNIQFSFMEKPLGSLLITSAGQSEGKTSTVANLSYAMAQAGKTVLMVDADLRKPTLSSLISSDNSPGLSGLIIDVFGSEVGKGSLKDLSVSDLFRLLTFQKRTGRLHLTDGAEKVDFLFLHGELKEIHWLTRPEKRKLAYSLVNNGLVKKEDIERAFVRHKAMGRKLGVTLINMGLLKEDELETILNAHMMEGLKTALQFEKGEFDFNELDISDFEHTSFDPVDFHHLYQQAVKGREDLPFLQGKIAPAIVKTTEENLFLLPSGATTPNPSELLGSARFSFLISILRKRFDLLVIDSPPILPASDALLLAPNSDGVLFVTKSGLLNRDMVIKGIESLRQINANLIGVALNSVDITKEGHYRNYYYYHHYYSKYYSKYYGEES